MASAKIIQDKQNTVEEITSKLNESESVILFSYQGLTVADIAELRRELKNNNSEVFEVAGVFDTDVQFGSFNNRTEVYLNIEECKELLNIKNNISEIVIELKNDEDISKDKKILDYVSIKFPECCRFMAE